MNKSILTALVCACMWNVNAQAQHPVKSERPAMKPWRVDQEKWAPVAAAAAQALARDQGEKWKRTYSDGHVLIGLGINGEEKLNQLINSSDPESQKLMALIVRSAAAMLSQPIRTYTPPSQAMRAGQTAVVAGNETWIRPVADQLVLLSAAARITGDATYRKRIHDQVLAICAFPTWGASPANADIVAGHVSHSIAVAWNWNPDLWTGAERKLVLDSVKSKVNTLCKAIYGGPGGYWAGMYTGNHNHVSVAGAGMAGLAFINDIPEAKEWLAAAWLNFREVAKHLSSDGSSPEGTAYWSYGLSYILQFIEAVNGVLPSYTLYDTPFFKSAAGYRVNNSTPGYSGIISWGDGYPVDFAGPSHYLFRLGSQFHDPVARYVATHATACCGGNDDVKVWAWLWSQPTMEEKQPEQPDYLANEYQVLNSRSGWADDDYVFSLKAGMNNRSHSHLDAGAFSLMLGSDWLLPRAPYGKGKDYQDFYDQTGGRWKYLSNSNESNSTLVINKALQRYDANAKGSIDHFASYPDLMTAECDLTEAYDAVKSVRRKVFHKRGEYILVYDAVSLASPGETEWLLQTPPNAVVNDNSVNIQGRSGSVTVTMLAPPASPSIREPQSEKRDLPEVRKTLAVSVSGQQAVFAVAIEPKISGRDNPDRTFSVSDDGMIHIHSAEADEQLAYADEATTISLGEVSATATMLYVNKQSGKVSQLAFTDAKNISTGKVSLSGDNFSGQLVKRASGGWILHLSAGSHVMVSGGRSISRLTDDKTSLITGALPGIGDYLLQ